MELINNETSKIVLLAVDSYYFQKSSRIALELGRKNLTVVHPQDFEHFRKISTHITKNDFLVTLFFTNQKDFREILKMLEFKKIRMIDTFSKMLLTENRAWSLKILREFNIKTPDFFYGSNKKIPLNFEEQIVQKNPYGHEVVLINRKSLSLLPDQNIYVENYIPNKTKAIRCVMYVFGKIYTRVKEDLFFGEKQTSGSERIVASTNFEIELVKKNSKNY